MRSRPGVAFLLTALAGCATPPERAGPDWFRPDPANPYAIFDAWRNLTTREAALYLPAYPGRAWTVIAGVLKDEEGRPLPLTPLAIYGTGMAEWGGRLRTDAKGRFIVYSPGSLDVRSHRAEAELDGMTTDEHLAHMNERACEFAACPGYPYSEAGFGYAASRDDYRRCGARLLMKTADRAFCELTCDGREAFDAEGFERFKKELMDEYSGEKRKPFRDRPRPHEGPTGDLIKTTYAIRVTSPPHANVGGGIPKAIVKFVASGGGARGNYQIVLTNAGGECSVDEYVDVKDPRARSERITRELTVDAPGYGVGPVNCEFSKGALNIVRMQEPAAVSGMLLDHNGNPTQTGMEVIYRRHCHCFFELCIDVAPDGSFSFERIIPGEPFKIVARRGGWAAAPVETEHFTLAPGERKEGIRLTVPLASAVRGILLDEKGAPATHIYGLTLMLEDGNNWGMGEPIEARFGFSSLGPQPFRIHVGAEGFRFYLSDWIRLERGELRFVELRARKLGKAHVSHFIEEFGERASFVRQNAAGALSVIGADAAQAVPALVRALRDEDWRMREAAAEALWGIGPAAKQAVPALVVALRDDNVNVRSDAASALGRIGPAAAVAAVPALAGALAEALGDRDEHVRAVAASALGEIGPGAKSAVPALARALADEDWDVRETAASSLGKIGPDAATAAPALVGLLRDAAPLLTENLWDDYRRTYTEGWRALAKIGPPAVAVLEKATGDDHPAVRDAAAEALKRIRAATVGEGGG